MLAVIGSFMDRGKATKIGMALFFLLLFNHSFSQEYSKIKAKSGDGIYSILKQHNLAPKEYFDRFVELNKDKLGKNHSLIIGRTYLLPAKEEKKEKEAVDKKAPVEEVIPSQKVYEIYGKGYHEVTVRSRELEGAVFFLMSGHGGPDPGAVGFLDNHMLCEDEYAYDVTLRLARNLTERGGTVYMIIRDPDDGIRDDAFLKPDRDEVCFPDQVIPLKQVDRLRQETEAVNKLHNKHKGKFHRLVVIHVDSRSNKENIDVFFYHNKGSKAGEMLAVRMKNIFGLRYQIHQPQRGYDGTVSHRNLYVINNSKPTSVFIELGNINHKRDQQRFLIADNRQALANWLRDGLIEDYRQSGKGKKK